MGSKPARSAIFAGGLLGAFLLHAAMSSELQAQHADAGVEHKAATPPPAPAEPPSPPAAEPAPPAAAEPAAPTPPSGILPKVINPTQLSEATRARLAERAAGRHPSNFAPREPLSHRELPPEAQGPATAVPPHRPRIGGNEPVARGQARARVQAVETDEGITLLSNRIQLPERRLSDALAKQPLPATDPPAVEDKVAAVDPSHVTETRSLRPLSTRAAKPKNSGAGLGWLLWPFVLFVSTGAVVGTLWFRKKTE